MRPIIALSLLLFQCAPESHVLLGGDAGDPDDAATDADGGPPTYVCQAAETRSIHGTPCEGGGNGCGAAATIPTAWWAQCAGSEWLAVRGTARTETAPESCTDALDLGSKDGWIESVDGPCFTVRTCEGYVYDLCQSNGRAGVRPDAMDLAPWVDCGSALASARDGDPCEGELRCGGDTESRGTIVLYCDETGVTRLIGGSGFTFVLP